MKLEHKEIWVCFLPVQSKAGEGSHKKAGRDNLQSRRNDLLCGLDTSLQGGLASVCPVLNNPEQTDGDTTIVIKANTIFGVTG